MKRLTSAFAAACLAATALTPAFATAGGDKDIAVEFVEGPQITVYSPTHVSMHMTTIIEAPIDVVWDTVMDENKDSSPLYFKFDGPMEEDATVKVSLHDVIGMNGGNDMTFEFEWSFVEGHRFGWSGPAVTGGPVYDNHQFVFTAIDEDTTLFSHSDDGTSTDLSVVDFTSEETLGFFKSLAQNGYIPFNKALKAEAERRYNQ